MTDQGSHSKHCALPVLQFCTGAWPAESDDITWEHAKGQHERERSPPPESAEVQDSPVQLWFAITALIVAVRFRGN